MIMKVGEKKLRGRNKHDIKLCTYIRSKEDKNANFVKICIQRLGCDCTSNQILHLKSLDILAPFPSFAFDVRMQNNF